MFYTWFLALRHMGSQLPDPWIEPASPALEGEVLTTGRPGKSPLIPFNGWVIFHCIDGPGFAELLLPVPKSCFRILDSSLRCHLKKDSSYWNQVQESSTKRSLCSETFSVVQWLRLGTSTVQIWSLIRDPICRMAQPKGKNETDREKLVLSLWSPAFIHQTCSVPHVSNRIHLGF